MTQAGSSLDALRTQKLRGKSERWGSFEVAMTEGGDGVQQKLRCHARLRASNPSRTAKVASPEQIVH